ncbi:MAG: hypothetical protein JSS07_11690 [Proteobacteria bacterium]|nr:hypothetical protein [Pseudomonadota bacterium]
MKVIKIKLNASETQNVELPHYINPIKYYDSKSKTEQARKLSAYLVDTIPFLDEKQRKEHQGYLQMECAELFEKIETNDNWSVCYQLQNIETTLKEVISIAEKQLIKDIDDKIDLPQDIIELKRLIEKLEPFITDAEKKRYISQYAAIKVQQLICTASYSEEHLKKLPPRNKKMTIEDIAVKSQIQQYGLEEKKVCLMSEMSQALMTSAEAKEQLKRNIKAQFSMLNTIISEQEKIQVKFTQSLLEKTFDNFIDSNFDKFMEVLKNSIAVSRLEKLLEIKQLKKALPSTSSKMHERLQTEIKTCEDEIKEKMQQLAQENQAIKLKMLDLFRTITKSSQQDKFVRVARRFGFDEKDYVNDGSLNEESSMISTWLATLSATMQAYLPSTEKVKLGVNVAQAGVLGYAFGVQGAIMGVGMALAQDKAKKVIAKLQERKAGKLNTKYKSKSFDVNDNLEFMYNSNEKAEIINCWYVNRLFEIDVKLENMSKMEQKENYALELQLLYDELFENYNKIRNAEVNKEQAKEIFRSDIKNMLIKYYKGDFNNTTQYLQVMGELAQVQSKNQLSIAQPPLEIQKTLQTQQTSALVKQKNDLLSNSSSKQLMPRLPTQTTLVSNTIAAAQSIAHEYKLIALKQRVLSCTSASKQVDENLAELERLANFLNTDNTMLQHWRNNDVLALQFKEATKLAYKATLEERVEKLVKENDVDSLLTWFRENIFTEMYNESKEIRLKMIGVNLEKFQGKTLWHLLSDLPHGVSIFNKIVAQQNNATSNVEKSIGLGWKFIDYFSPDVKYNNMNPIEYAFKQENKMILIEYLNHLVRCEYQISNYKEIFSFVTALNKHAEVFCIVLNSRIIAQEQKNQSTFARFKNVISKPIYQPSYHLGIMSALIICLAREQNVPKEPLEIAKFIKELQQEKSVYVYLSGLSKLQNTEIEQIANKASNDLKDYAEAINTQEVVSSEKIKQNHLIEAAPAILSQYTKDNRALITEQQSSTQKAESKQSIKLN